RLVDCGGAGYARQVGGPGGWRVWALDAPTLAPEGEHAVPAPVHALAATPDGGDAFVLAGRDTLLRLGPRGGPAVPFATLPDIAFRLAATDDPGFALDVFRGPGWGPDRHRAARAPA